MTVLPMVTSSGIIWFLSTAPEFGKDTGVRREETETRFEEKQPGRVAQTLIAILYNIFPS